MTDKSTGSRRRLRLMGSRQVILLIGGLLFTLALTATVILLWRPGCRATPDSAAYLDAAQNLAMGRGYFTMIVGPNATTSMPLAKFAPGFSWAISLGIRAGFAPLTSARFVLALAFVAYCVFSLGICFGVLRGLRSLLLGLFVVSLLCLHPGALETLDSIWSDLPAAAFANLIVLVFVWLIALKRRPGIVLAVGIGAMFGLLLLSRWANLYFICAVACAFVVSASDRKEAVSRLKQGVWMFVGFGLAAGPWLCRNVKLAGSLFGHRDANWRSPLVAVCDSLVGITGLTPYTAPPLFGGDGVLLNAIVASTVIVFVAAMWMLRSWQRPHFRFLVTVILGYWALMVASWTVHPVDPLWCPRFWLPVLPSLLVLPFSMSDNQEKLVRGRVFLSLAVTLLCFWGCTHAWMAHRGLPRAGEGKEWLEPSISNAELFQKAGEMEGSRTLFSNDPRLIVLHRPGRLARRMVPNAARMRHLIESEGSACIVFFKIKTAPSVWPHQQSYIEIIETLDSEGMLTLALRIIWGSSGLRNKL